jgi:hypothetical protein
MFLTPKQLQRLTGYRKPALQRRWLVQNGYSFDVRRDGKPVVSQDHYQGRQGGQRAERASGFDLGALDKIE